MAQPPGKTQRRLLPLLLDPSGRGRAESEPPGAAHEHGSPRGPKSPPVSPNPPRGRFPRPACVGLQELPLLPRPGRSPLASPRTQLLFRQGSCTLCVCPPLPPGALLWGFWCWAFWGRKTAPWCWVRAPPRPPGGISAGAGERGAGGAGCGWAAGSQLGLAADFFCCFISHQHQEQRPWASGGRELPALLQAGKRKAKSHETGALPPCPASSCDAKPQTPGAAKAPLNRARSCPERGGARQAGGAPLSPKLLPPAPPSCLLRHRAQALFTWA